MKNLVNLLIQANLKIYKYTAKIVRDNTALKGVCRGYIYMENSYLCMKR